MIRGITDASFAEIELALASPRRARFIMGHVFEVLSTILARPTIPADSIVSRFYRDRRYLGSHDRGCIADITYDILRGVLRHRKLLDRYLIPDAIDRAAALHIVCWLTEQGLTVPTHILADFMPIAPHAIDQVPERLDRALRDLAGRKTTEQLAVASGLPVWVVEAISSRFHENVEDALAGFNRQAPITLRANRLLTSRERLVDSLAQDGIASSPGIYSPDAILLEHRLNAHGLRQFRSGWFEVQDEGSQMLSIMLDPHPGWSVFDACAGGGGKTLHLSAIMRGKGGVFAHDINDRRLSDLRPRLKRSSAQNVRTMYHEEYRQRLAQLEGTFDAVLIDAPCSGTGVLRRNPGARLSIDRDMVSRMTRTQAGILKEYSRLAKPGGLVLYATCSLLDEEDEAQVDRFLEGTDGWVTVPIEGIDPSMVTSAGYYRSWPHLHNTDAFFGALLRRTR